ncbi:MAG: MBL fold metallo-hydrolase [Spirochaetes bacterium]|jgi:mRNA degradation ribonuclease J1/J2|nr:MBL fold metallo-hydrolase [Spirochaetota bacterium]
MKCVSLKDQPFALKNDGSLQLFFVGTGSAFTKINYQTNLLIIKGEDHLLVDCGTKCPQAFTDLGSSITEVQNFLITHSHADHIGGLEEVALMNKYMTHKKPTMTINETYQYILWEMSLRGGSAYNEENAGDILTFFDFFNINRPKVLQDYQRETLEAQVGSINLKIFRTKHIPDNSRDWESSFWSCGLIIDERVMYTSDTRFDQGLVEYFDSRFNLEAIFHDCQLFTGGVHASIDELNSLPEPIKQKMRLVHYGDNYKDFIKTAEEYKFKGFADSHVYYTFE